MIALATTRLAARPIVHRSDPSSAAAACAVSAQRVRKVLQARPTMRFFSLASLRASRQSGYRASKATLRLTA